MSLSLLPVLLIFTTMGFGWWIGDYNGVFSRVTRGAQSVSAQSADDNEEQLLLQLALLKEPQRRFTTHFQLGLASALATVLINSLSVTYLIGTSRWVKEVCEAYELDGKFIAQSAELKRSTFPWSVAGVFAILAIVAFGAASDPGTLGESTAKWVTPHMIAAMVGSSVIVFAICFQAMNLHRNAQIIEEVVGEVQRERVARGLPVE
jgi:hypothetical protein